MVWSLSKNRCYNTRSGYKLLETILYVNSGQKSQLPLVERQLWRNLCKCKYPPKVKNFMWRAMSGVLAVKQRLRSRGIVLDTTCQVCRTQQESICHVFFTAELLVKHGSALEFLSPQLASLQIWYFLTFIT